VRQRQKQLAILRAIGASRSAVVGQVLGEALLIGLCACALGGMLGVAMARAGVEQTAETVSRVYQVVNVEGIVVTPLDLLLGAVIGLLVPLVAALRPALWVAGQPPYEGLSRPPEEGDAPGGAAGLVLGGTLAALGLVAFALPAARDDVWLGQGAFGLVLVGDALPGARPRRLGGRRASSGASERASPRRRRSPSITSCATAGGPPSTSRPSSPASRPS